MDISAITYKKKNYLLVMVSIIKGDCIKILPTLPDNSIDLILTDPPYFIGKLTNQWKDTKKPNSHITHLPKGMAFSKNQTIQLYDFYKKIAEQAIKKLKPGGYFLSFSAPRLYHAIAMANDEAGLEVRDMLNWVYTQSMPKGMSIQRFIEASSLDKNRKKELTDYYKDFKTPMIRSCTEPICVAMKPREGTFFNNELTFTTGLVDFSQKTGLDNHCPSNVITTEIISPVYDKNFLVKKPSKKEKEGSNHPTIKPIELIEHLIRLYSKEGATVLDPFLGSGTTAKACLKSNRKCIGIEKNSQYFYDSVKGIVV